MYTQVETYWHQARPQELAELSALEQAELFERLAAELAQVTDQFVVEMMPPASTGQGALETAGTVNAVRAQAAEMAWAQVITEPFPPIEESETPDEFSAEMNALHRELSSGM